MFLFFRLVLVFLSLVFASNAGFYLGTGVSVSQNNYTINSTYGPSSNVGNNSLLQKAFNVSKTAAAGISATSSYQNQQIVALTKYITAKDVNDMSPIRSSVEIGGEDGTSFVSFNDFCVSNGVVVGSALQVSGGSPACANGTATAPSVDWIAQDIGNTFLNQYQMLLKKLSKNLEFDSVNARIKFTEYFGNQILTQLNGGTPVDPNDLEAVYKLISEGIFTTKQADNNFKLLLNNELLNGDILSTEAQLKPISDALSTTLKDIDPTIVGDEFTNPAEDASSTGVEALLSFGYMNNYNGFYYGGEGLLEYGFNQIGNNANSEIVVKYDFTGSILGRVGYGFSEKSFGYANLGFALRQYKASFGGYSDNKYIPHIIVGLGLEFNINRYLNIFTEINYLVGLKKFDLANIIDNGIDMKLTSQKLSVGVRYYLDRNSITQPSSVAQRNKALQNSPYKTASKFSL